MVCVAAASQPAALFKNERPFSVLFFGESSKGHSGMLPSSCSGGGTQIVLRNQKNSAITKIIFLRQSTPEMLWNKQKARLNGGVPIFEKGADVLLLPKSRVRHHHQFKRPARQMTALESSPHQRTRITVEAFGQAGEPLGSQCSKVRKKSATLSLRIEEKIWKNVDFRNR